LGGVETHVAFVARLLARHHDVSVLTTTAGDYQTWTPAFAPGVSDEDGVRVRRFPVARGRAASWGLMTALLHEGFESSEFAALSEPARREFSERVAAWPEPLQEEFVLAQGPL